LVEDVEGLAGKLKEAPESDGENVSNEQPNAWKGSLRAISFLNSTYLS